MHTFWKSIGQVFFEGTDLGGGGGGGAAEVDLGSVIADSIPQEIRDTPEQKVDAPDPEEEKELAALEQDIRTKNPAMRGNIAIHRHQAVLTRTRNQHAKAQEEWAAKEKAWQERQDAIAQQEAEWKQYEWAKDPDIRSGLEALALAEADQDKFIDLLLQDPRYAERIQRIVKEEKKAQAEGRPRPNKKSEDGSLEYYDDEGTDQLLNWYGNSLKESLSKELRESIGKEMEEKYGEVAKAYKQSALWNKTKAESGVKLEQYRKEWDGFKEYEKDIKALLVKNDEDRAKDSRVPVLSIEEAYIKTVPGKFREAGKVSEEAVRKKILEEMKLKPAAAQQLKPNASPEKGAEHGERDLADVIRANMPRE